MKYLQNIICFLIPTINFKLSDSNDFFDKLEIETIEILEDLGSNYLLGLLNYSYQGCLEDFNAQQLLNEHGLFLDQYLSQTNDTNLSILLLCDYLGY
ncbi:MAG: hypothetical protein CL691_00390 [Cellvibrionales bacterium]|nr:hypothetical protein [Cellvibrionales bacterium]